MRNLERFLLRQLSSPEFYLLLFATLVMTLMHVWRRSLRDQIFWGGMA